MLQAEHSFQQCPHQYPETPVSDSFAMDLRILFIAVAINFTCKGEKKSYSWFFSPLLSAKSLHFCSNNFLEGWFSNLVKGQSWMVLMVDNRRTNTFSLVLAKSSERTASTRVSNMLGSVQRTKGHRSRVWFCRWKGQQLHPWL